VGEDGLAGPRLAGQHVEAGAELKLGLFDQQEVAYAQLGEHLPSEPAAGDGPQPSLRSAGEPMLGRSKGRDYEDERRPNVSLRRR
jgi:hypothetical protein